jgi:hypothetical protein
MYLNVPFCKVNQLLTGVLNVPAISQVRVVACEVPLFTVTLLKIVNGLVPVIDALLDP